MKKKTNTRKTMKGKKIWQTGVGAGPVFAYMNHKRGITLTTLVIAIIILLILAGITISLTIGQNGIITKAAETRKAQEIAEIKERLSLEILNAETDAIIRNENLEKTQLNDIINKYGTLQEDGDTIITKEKQYEISLKEIWYGVLSNSGSYTDKVEQIEILEKELADLKKQYEELEKLNEGNANTLQELNRQIAELEEQKKILEEEKKELEEQVATLSNEKEELTNENTRLKEALVQLNNEYQSFKKTEATATVTDILEGKTAWVNENKITGTMVNRGTLDWNPTTSTTYTVPAGYYSGGTLNSEEAYNAGYNAGVTAGKNNATVVVTVYGVGGSSAEVGSRTYTLTYPSSGNYSQGDGDTRVSISWK